MDTFTVLKNFHCEELNCDYSAGFSYRVTPRNAAHLQAWLADGRVVMSAKVKPGTAGVRGQGMSK
jgi:hypothetical protein